MSPTLLVNTLHLPLLMVYVQEANPIKGNWSVKV
jgi:hypothetical protein